MERRALDAHAEERGGSSIQVPADRQPAKNLMLSIGKRRLELGVYVRAMDRNKNATLGRRE